MNPVISLTKWLAVATLLIVSPLRGGAQVLANGSFEAPRVSLNTLMQVEPAGWKWGTRMGFIYNGHVLWAGDPWPSPAHLQQFVNIGDEPAYVLSQEFNIPAEERYRLQWFDNTGHIGQVFGAPYTVSIFTKAGEIIATRRLDAYHVDQQWRLNFLEISLPSGTFILEFKSSNVAGGLDTLLDDVSITTLAENEDLRSNIRVSSVEICWSGRTNTMYQVQYSTDLATSDWTNFGAPVRGTANNCVSDLVVSGEQRFYRIIRV